VQTAADWHSEHHLRQTRDSRPSATGYTSENSSGILLPSGILLQKSIGKQLRWSSMRQRPQGGVYFGANCANGRRMMHTLKLKAQTAAEWHTEHHLRKKLGTRPFATGYKENPTKSIRKGRENRFPGAQCDNSRRAAHTLELTAETATEPRIL